MATYRFYRAPRIGTGSIADPFRSKIQQYTQNYVDWIHDARGIHYTLVHDEPAVHATIEADAQITPLSPEGETEAQVESWLNGTVQNLPVNVQTILENDGCSLGWVDQSTTRRQLFRYLAKLHVATQDLRRLKNADSLQLFAALLDNNINTLPAQVRQKVNAWMQGKGLDTSWITGATKVRQVVHYVLQNVDWTVLKLGPFSFPNS